MLACWQKTLRSHIQQSDYHSLKDDGLEGLISHMAMTPERAAERVELLIESIRHGLGHSYAEHNVALTLDYVEQVHDLGIINREQFIALVVAVNEAADNWQPKVDPNGLPIEHDLDHST
jgi:hypothetical protein